MCSEAPEAPRLRTYVCVAYTVTKKMEVSPRQAIAWPRPRKYSYKRKRKLLIAKSYPGMYLDDIGDLFSLNKEPRQLERVFGRKVSALSTDLSFLRAASLGCSCPLSAALPWEHVDISLP